MCEDPALPPVAYGTVDAPVLDALPLTVAGGAFRLFAPVDQPDIQHMTYRLPLAADDGRDWFAVGHKVIDQGRLRDLWHDTTTLFLDVHEGVDDSGPIAYRGVLRISIGDFSHQLRTMTVRNARTETQRLLVLAKFGGMFTGNLFDHYGGIFGALTPLDPDAPPRGAASGHASDPAVHQLGWNHANLNPETHDAIHEMMGIANMEMMSHLARCAIHGKLVDSAGDDTYLPNFERLSMPITLIQGKDHQVWRLKATETTYDQLVDTFGPDNYRRHVVPRYGHLDTVFGKDADHDTYPLMLEHLDRVRA